MRLSRPSASTLRSIAFGAIIAGGVLASFALYRSVVLRDNARREDEFNRHVQNRRALIGETLRGFEECLYALKLLFIGSDEVTRAEFGHAAGALLRRHPGIFALQWVPVVDGTARAAWERAAAAELGKGFRIVEHAADGAIVPAGEREQFLPILFSEPANFAWNPVGCDLGAGSLRTTLQRAGRSDALALSGRITLVSTSGNSQGVVMALPVFTDLTDTGAPRTLRGYLVGIFRIDDLLVQTWRRSSATIADVMFIDESANSAEQRLLYYHLAASSFDGIPPSEGQFRAAAHTVIPLEIGGRHWVMIFRPSSIWIMSPVGRFAGLILLAGLSCTGLLAAFLASLARHARVVEREVAERTAELSESRRQLDSLVRALPGAAYRCRYDRQMTILYVSEGALALTGHEAAAFVSGGVQFRDLISPEDLPRVRDRTQSALLVEKGPFEVEYRIRARDGREKWVLSRGRGVYAADGSLRFFEGLAIDVTDRKQAEAASLAMERKLLETQKLESLGLLAGGIAHDFNNLLTGILGSASLARLAPDLGPSTGDHLRRIESAASRAAELCQQMLAYSGRGRFRVEAVDLGRIVRDTIPLLKGSIPPHAKLELALAAVPTVVTADATQIRQILMNLVLNAVDALGAVGGQIVVTTGCARLDGGFFASASTGENLTPGDYVVLEVRDTGCGMTPDTVRKIFDPFFTTKFTGRGLGLAAVLGIVRGHSGALRVQSAPGSGTTFTLALPPSGENPAFVQETRSANPWRAQGRILVIDDEPPVRDVAAELVRSFGLSAVTAADGAEGIERFRADPSSYSLVLLDLTMPGLDGEETLARLRAISPGVRVLLISGYSDNERIARMSDGGPLLFMQKPFTRAKLERNLREILA